MNALLRLLGWRRPAHGAIHRQGVFRPTVDPSRPRTRHLDQADLTGAWLTIRGGAP